MADGPRFRGVMAMEGVETSDSRIIGANESTWRELPLTLMVMTASSHGGMPSSETQVAGRLDLIERQPAPAGTVLADGQTQAFQLYYEGTLNDDEVGAATADKVGNKSLRGVSIDFGADEQYEETAWDDEGWPTDYRILYTAVEIMALTVCPTPAFAGCYIELIDSPADVPADDPQAEPVAADLIDLVASAALPGLRPRPCVPCGSARAGLVASAGIPTDPPAAWFEQPQLTGVTALTIEDNGRVYGHLAPWGECHVGVDGACITPPRSASNYARFRLASVRTAEGTRVATGPLFMGTRHADSQHDLSVQVVQDHYADTGTATADVAVYEDAWGIVVAGAARPDLTPEQLRAARGSVLSGDWREVVRGSGQLELVAALHVNTPGFGVPRAELVASGGRPVALVAAGASASRAVAVRQRADSGDDVYDRLARRLDRALAPLVRPVVEQQRQRAREIMAGIKPPTPGYRPAPPASAAGARAAQHVRAVRKAKTAAVDVKDGKAEDPADKQFLTDVGTHLGPLVDLCGNVLDASQDADVADFATHLRDTLTAQGATAQHLLDGGVSDGASLRAAITAAVGRGGNTETLMEYWSHGVGAAKIGWGSDGDHTRCVRELGKYVGPGIVHGLCTNLQQRAIGTSN